MSKDLCQYPTPLWVAEALIERYFPKLDAADLVIEPSCGMGAFLRAVPGWVPAVGVEIDPAMATTARVESGREIIVGDFRTVEISVTPTAIIGNPPFRAEIFDGFLDRCYDLLPEGARAGFILPNYFLQTASRVLRYTERWSVKQEMIPRHAFSNRMRTPLTFALFSKDRTRVMIGFALYPECSDLMQMAKPYRSMLESKQGSMWRAVCRLALERLGGSADLPQIYAELERNRPTRTKWWREKIRQTLRAYRADFSPVKNGVYQLRTA